MCSLEKSLTTVLYFYLYSHWCTGCAINILTFISSRIKLRSHIQCFVNMIMLHVLRPISPVMFHLYDTVYYTHILLFFQLEQRIIQRHADMHLHHTMSSAGELLSNFLLKLKKLTKR